MKAASVNSHQSHGGRVSRLRNFALACALLFAAEGGVGAVRARGCVDDDGSQRAATTAGATTREERLAVFDDVWQTVRERYYDAGMGGVDWAAARAEFRPRAAEAGNQSELYVVLRRMLARLRDPHTRVYAPEEYSDWREPRYVTIGVRVREVSGELVVTEVERGSEAERAGVRAGDVVLSIDGETVAAILARRLSEQSAASNAKAARVVAAARLFDGPRDSLANVVFSSGAAREKNVRLRRVLGVRTPSLRVRRAAGGYGVVQFNLFTPQIAAGLARALRTELREARGIVIDLRDNGGGEAETMTDIASSFLPKGTKLGRFTDREGRVQLEPQTREVLLSAAETVTNFGEPVVVLTSTRTASAAEVFVAALKERRRARVVGETTCGCVLGIRRHHRLPDGGVLEVSEVDFRTASGVRLEGAGLVPDEAAVPTRRDILAGRDRALARALEILDASRARAR